MSPSSASRSSGSKKAPKEAKPQAAKKVRPAPRGQERLREAAKLGFTQAIIPTANQPRQPIDGIEIIAVDRLAEAVARLRG